MKRKHDTRDVPEGAKRRVDKKGQAQALLVVFGKEVWCDLTPTGRAKVQRPEWYGSLKMSDGSTKVVKLCRDKMAAELMLAKLKTTEERISVGIDIRPSSTSEKFFQLVARYWADKARIGCTDVYIRNSRWILARSLADLAVDSLEGLKKVTEGQLVAWVDRLKIANGSKKQKTIQVKGFMRWLLAARLLPRVPTFPTISEVTKYTRRPLSRHEVDLLEKNSPWPRGLFYALGFATLARRGAILSLLPQDIHLDGPDAWLLLRAANSKTRTTQQVPVPRRLVIPLRELIDQCPPGVPLFHAMNGHNLHKAFWRDLKASGIPQENERGRAMIHGLRHGGATEMLEKGVSVLLVQRMGGWRSLQVLSKHYAHLSPIRSRKEIDNVFE
jgi:integrase